MVGGTTALAAVAGGFAASAWLQRRGERDRAAQTRARVLESLPFTERVDGPDLAALPPSRLLLAEAMSARKAGAPFWGRRSELEQLQTWLTDSKSLVCMVTGPASVGKTRLSLEFARALPEE